MKKIVTAKTHTLSIEYGYEHAALRVVIVGIIGLVFLYIYFVFTSIFNIMAEKVADTRSQQIQNSIASLEDTYFQVTRSVHPEDASSLGLTTLAKPSYVTRLGTIGDASGAPNRDHGSL